MKVQHQDKVNGFALVITLIMVVLAAIIVIVFLISASTDRTTSKSVSDRLQAELAVQNGLEAAKKALIATPTAAASLTKDDSFLIVRVDAPAVPITPAAPVTSASYYYLAKAQAGAASKIDYYPLFAGGSPTIGRAINLAASAAPPAVTRPTPPPNPDPNSAGTAAIDTDSGKTKILKAYPAVSSWLGPPSTQWIELHDPTDTATTAPYTLPYQRYTFWVEDLAGYLDASQVGNEINSGKHQRSNGTNPNELALFTIFDAINPIDLGSTLAKNLIDNRALLFTVPTLQQVAPPPTGQTDLSQPNLAVRLGVDTGGEQNLVPFGYGYPAAVEGKPRTDLNSLISTKNITSLANAITTALPNFKNRAGGLPSTFDYTTNLAANIVDYADPSNAPTTDGSTYRGVGAFPFLVEAFDLNNWVAVTGGPPNDYFVTIEVTTYLQLWNPHNVPVSGSLTVHYENVDTLDVNGNTDKYTSPPDYVDTAFSLNPNEYKVISLPKPGPSASPQPQSYSFDWGSTPPATSGPTPSQSNIPMSIPNPGTTVNSLLLKWNGKVADRTFKNVSRSYDPVGMRYNNTKAFGKSVWKGNAAPPIYPAVGTPGDPRISYYLDRVWTSGNYDTNSSWGGRLWLKGVTPVVQVQPSTWPDGGHDSTLGFNPTNATTPDVAATKVTPAYSTTGPDAKMWISRLSTRATPGLDALAELGNVFDPGQWKYTIPSSYPLPTPTATAVPDIPISATPDSTAGGGYTLCIGRPEFSKFDSNGNNLAPTSQRAWQLLDIFGLGARTSTVGVVNLNTASFEALRALAAGIIHDRDAAIQPSTLYPPAAKLPTSSEQQPPTRTSGGPADLFAEAVIQSRPLLSIAQLQTIKNNLGPFFGNANQWKDQTVPSEWNDSAREELFSKMLNLTTVRSRNFRVFVTGQALDKNGNVLSTVNTVFQVFLKPSRDPATGKINSQQTEIRYEAFL